MLWGGMGWFVTRIIFCFITHPAINYSLKNKRHIIGMSCKYCNRETIYIFLPFATTYCNEILRKITWYYNLLFQYSILHGIYEVTDEVEVFTYRLALNLWFKWIGFFSAFFLFLYVYRCTICDEQVLEDQQGFRNHQHHQCVPTHTT